VRQPTGAVHLVHDQANQAFQHDEYVGHATQVPLLSGSLRPSVFQIPTLSLTSETTSLAASERQGQRPHSATGQLMPIAIGRIPKHSPILVWHHRGWASRFSWTRTRSSVFSMMFRRPAAEPNWLLRAGHQGIVLYRSALHGSPRPQREFF